MNTVSIAQLRNQIDDNLEWEDVLTPAQLLMFAIIVDQCHKGRVVTIHYLGKRMGISSPNGVIGHLNSLEEKGLITRDRLKAGTIRPLRRIELDIEALERHFPKQYAAIMTVRQEQIS